MKRSIYTEFALESVIDDMRALWRHEEFLMVSFSTKKPRSLDQNALAAVWYEQIARELEDGIAEEKKAECKLRFGVPILLHDDAEFLEFWMAHFHGLPYERQLKLMRFVPVTSRMDTGQLSRYLEAMQQAFRGVVDLRFPEAKR